MLGQPASSHTVTRPRSWIGRTRAGGSPCPMRTGTRTHSGLRCAMSRPSSGATPAWRRRRSRGRSPAPSTSLGAAGPVTTSARSASPPPNTAVAAPRSASTTSSIDTSMPSAASEVTPRSAIPHGTMWSNIARSVVTLRATPCTVRRRPGPDRARPARRWRRSCGAAPPPSRPTRRGTRRRRSHPGSPRSASVVDDQLLQPVHVRRARAETSSGTVTIG